MHCDISARFFLQTPGTTRHDPAPAGLEACILIPKFDCMNQTTAPLMTSANPLLDFSGLPRFDAIRPEQVQPAITQLLLQA